MSQLHEASAAYDLIEHRHRFSAWAAARAATRGGRFGIKTDLAPAWLENIGLRDLLANIENLPEPAAFDGQHRAWRVALIGQAGEGLSHGKAAKLINVYLKAGVVGASCQPDGQQRIEMRERIGAIHPPVDSFLLKKIVSLPQWKGEALFRQPWSSLSSDGYEQLIDRLKPIASRPNDLLEFWRLEQFWDGYQS